MRRCCASSARTMTTTTATTARAAKGKCTGGAAGVRPLLSSGRRVTVDGHPICSECGAPVEPVRPDQWRHGLSRRPRLTPLASYTEFNKRFPWVVVPEDEWRRASDAFAEYREKLKGFQKTPVLGSGGNPCLELFEILMAGPMRLLDLDERRRELASLFSWAIPTEPALAVLAAHAPLVECGAGMGYWTALLRARGVDALAYDLAPPAPGKRNDNRYHRGGREPWTEIWRASAATAARRHRE